MRDSALLKDILRLIADYWFRPFSQTPFAPAMHLSLAAPARLLHLHPSCSRTSQSQTGLQARPWDPACPASRQDSLSASSRQYLLSLASAACLFLAPAAAAADDTTLSFNKNCIGCHVGGGNVVQGGASLRLPDLQKNGAASVEAIYDLVYSGKGKMPGYGAGCTPKGKCTFGPRLSDVEIQRLSQFVVDKAEQGWQ